jgi:hypothetical protein
MKTKLLVTFAAIILLLYSCKKVDNNQNKVIPDSVLKQINPAGFSNENVVSLNGGYLIEGDIFLTQAQLDAGVPNGAELRVGDEEQYHTTNLIKALPRTITVSMNYPTLTALFTAATDTAIKRYNAMGLKIIFQRVSGTGQINIVGADLGGGGILGQSSGFPSSAGNPASPITLNSHSGTFTANTNVQWLGTIIAHEMGHCIGFRHTDYANRAYSCGGRRVNEGSAGVGAIYVPGTQKSYKDPGSWMLSCTDGSNRPFNPNDKIALNFLYK